MHLVHSTSQHAIIIDDTPKHGRDALWHVWKVVIAFRWYFRLQHRDYIKGINHYTKCTEMCPLLFTRWRQARLLHNMALTKGQQCGHFVAFLLLAWTNCCTNIHIAGDKSRRSCDVTAMYDLIHNTSTLVWINRWLNAKELLTHWSYVSFASSDRQEVMPSGEKHIARTGLDML